MVLQASDFGKRAGNAEVQNIIPETKKPTSSIYTRVGKPVIIESEIIQGRRLADDDDLVAPLNQHHGKNSQ